MSLLLERPQREHLLDFLAAVNEDSYHPGDGAYEPLAHSARQRAASEQRLMLIPELGGTFRQERPDGPVGPAATLGCPPRHTEEAHDLWRGEATQRRGLELDEVILGRVEIDSDHLTGPRREQRQRGASARAHDDDPGAVERTERLDLEERILPYLSEEQPVGARSRQNGTMNPVEALRCPS